MPGRLGRKPLLGAQVNWSHPLAKGLVGLWLFNEGSGGTVFDLSQNDYDVTLTNMDPATDWVPGRDSWALSFDATEGEYLQLATGVTVLTAGQPFTIMWWEKINSDTDAFPSRFILEIDGDADQFSVLRSNSGLYTPLNIGLDNDTSPSDHMTPTLAPTITASVGIWRHWVITGVDPVSTNNSDFSFYVDGISYSISDGGGLVNISGSNRIAYDGQDNGANCQMADIRILNRRITQGEVRSIYYSQYAIFKKSPYGRIFVSVTGDLTISVNEAISLTERVLQGKGQIVRDNITLAERVLQGKGQAVSESIGLAEGINEGKGQIIRDTITLAELVQLGKGLIVIDDITLGEQITAGKGQILRDAITVAEIILQGKGQIVRDTISIAEDISAVLTSAGALTASENEAISLSELVQLGKGQITRDTISIAEQIVLGKGQIVRDSITLAELVQHGKGQIVRDTITIAELVTVVLSPLLVNVSDAISLAENITATIAANVISANVFDAITVSDVLTLTLSALTQKIMFMLELAKQRMFSLELEQKPQFKLEI